MATTQGIAMDSNECLGFIKYEGALVADGLMDARKQANALLGLDQALRFFISKQIPEFRDLDFEIPVQVSKGSWAALIPETVAGWAQAGLGLVATAYFTTAAQRMADRDFEGVGFKDIFAKSIAAIKWFAKIGKHMGDASIRKFEDVVFSSDQNFIGIRNESGDVFWVPKEALDLYVATSPKLLERIAINIEEGRDLRIASWEKGGLDSVVIDVRDKWIFCRKTDEVDDGLLFPELLHGDEVVLEGEVTRENKTTNSMGFKYKGHILTAYPQVGSIVPYKEILFLRCRIYAIVSRMDEDGFITSRRPKLYFSSIDPLDIGGSKDLFS